MSKGQKSVGANALHPGVLSALELSRTVKTSSYRRIKVCVLFIDILRKVTNVLSMVKETAHILNVRYVVKLLNRTIPKSVL